MGQLLLAECIFLRVFFATFPKQSKDISMLLIKSYKLVFWMEGGLCLMHVYSSLSPSVSGDELITHDFDQDLVILMEVYLGSRNLMNVELLIYSPD